MRITRLAKVLAAAGAVLCSFLIGFFATFRSSAARPMRDGERLATARTIEGQDGVGAPPAGGKTLRATASYSGTRPLVIPGGDTVLVSASFSIRDSRPNLGYVWAVHFFHPEDADHEFPIFENWFDDRPIEVEGDVSVKSTLLEEIPFPFPSGDYRILVGAYRIPPGGEVADLEAKPMSELLKSEWGHSMGTWATIGF